jgi:RNA polymerase sigma factor (sigma-70 family)
MEKQRRSWYDLLLQGEEAAFRAFASSFGVRFERWLIAWGYAQADAIEISGEVPAIILLRLDKFVPPNHQDVEEADARFLAWAWVVAKNHARDWRRKNRPNWLANTPPSPLQAACNVLDAVDHDSHNPRIQAVREHLAALPDQYREIIILKDFVGETSFREVAGILEIQEGAARVRHHRAKQNLLARLRSDPRCQ